MKKSDLRRQLAEEVRCRKYAEHQLYECWGDNDRLRTALQDALLFITREVPKGGDANKKVAESD